MTRSRLETVAARLLQSCRCALEAGLNLLLPYPCLACETLAQASDRRLGLCPDCRLGLRLTARPGCRGCGRPTARFARPDPLCGSCRASPPPYDRLVAAFEYRPPLSTVVLGLKTSRLEYLADDLAAALLARDHDRLAQCDVVTPIPLAPLRLFRRGFNQAESLTRVLSEQLDRDWRRLLSRRPRPKQALQSRARRIELQRGAFRCRQALQGERVLLVDDVVTTGSTVRAATECLLAAGAKSVVVAAAARTPSWDE